MEADYLWRERYTLSTETGRDEKRIEKEHQKGFHCKLAIDYRQAHPGQLFRLSYHVKETSLQEFHVLK